MTSSVFNHHYPIRGTEVKVKVKLKFHDFTSFESKRLSYTVSVFPVASCHFHRFISAKCIADARNFCHCSVNITYKDFQIVYRARE
jgi:hypothetical protein